MVWTFSVFTLFGLFASVLCATLAIYAWHHRGERSARSFFGLMVALTLWSLIYGMQLGATHVSLAWFLQGLTLGVAGFVPVLWFAFVLELLELEGWLSRHRLGGLVLEPVLFFALAVTNGLHGTVWTDLEVLTTELGVIGALAFGPLYYAHIVFAYAIVGIGVLMIAARLLRVSARRRGQHALLLLAVFPPFLSHISYTLEASPIAGLDVTPFVFALSAIIFGFAIFRFSLLDRSVLARERALEEMGDGVIVVDGDGRVEDINAIARRVLEPTLEIGDSIDTVFRADDVSTLDGELIDAGARTFDLRVWPLRDGGEKTIGFVLVLRDVTDLRTYQQQLEVSSRILRHNIRNGMTVIAGHADTLEREAADGEGEYARTIRERAEELMDMAEKARRMTSSVDPTRRDETEVDLGSFLAERRERFAATYPGIRFTLACPDAVTLRTDNPDALAIAVENILENAAEHNDAADPVVTITVQTRDDEIVIEFADNGAGIPDEELDVLERGRETAVDHGQGLGLWLAYWGARASGGDISFSSEDGGTAVSIAYPRAPQRAPQWT